MWLCNKRCDVSVSCVLHLEIAPLVTAVLTHYFIGDAPAQGRRIPLEQAWLWWPAPLIAIKLT
jgi:hypothetical protein